MHCDTAFVLLSMLFQTDPRPAGVQEMTAQAAAPQDDWKVITLGKSKLTFYGFLRLDFEYDTSRPQTIQIPQWILSKDSTVPAEAAVAGKKDYTFHPRLTRLGLDLDGPTVAELGDAKVTGKLEMDFFNLTDANLPNNSREFLRLRHAYGKMDWGHFSILFGQREDVASPLFPTVNADMVMWNAGNTGDRRPQLRLEGKAEGFTLTGAVGVTGANDAANLDGPAATNNFFDGETGNPTWQARLGYEIEGWVEKKKNTIGFWTHWAREKLDVAVAATGFETDFTSNMFGVDLTLYLHDRVWLKGELWMGKNLDDVRGGIAQGVTTTAIAGSIPGHEVRSQGGWAELWVQVLSWWTPVFGISFDDPDDKYFGPMNRDLDVIPYLCNRLTFGPISMGFDYMHWVTEYEGPGIRDGRNERLDFWIAYNF